MLIVGEYLLNFHPGANHDIEAYLEKNGFEIIEARMTDVIRKIYFNKDSQVKEYHVKKPLREKLWYATANRVFEAAHALTDRIAKIHPLYQRACRLPELVKKSDAIIPHTFDAGEGVLIPGGDPAPCSAGLPGLHHSAALWLPAQSCCGQRYCQTG